MSARAIPLDGAWTLAHFDGYGEFVDAPRLPPALPHLPTLPARVPGAVADDLMRAGWIADVYRGGAPAARWIETEYWFYRRAFAAPPLAADERCWLVLDGLDCDACVFLNGALLARHANFYRPCRVEVTRALQPGANELVVRLDSGLLGVADRAGGDYNREVTATATARAWLRKPHFACRWDWAPRLMNVGIGGGVRLEVARLARFDQVVVTPEVAPDHRSAVLRVRAVVESLAAHAAPLSLTVAVEGAPAGRFAAELAPGIGELRGELRLDHPRLWWPRSHGEPHLTQLDVALEVAGQILDQRRIATGIRKVELCQDPAPDGQLFQLRVNGAPIFCRGANWVPPDLLYTRPDAEVTNRLVALAGECGCNLLRVWGGGLYASDTLLDACDRAGMLIWHDLMFACTQYPADDADFAAEATREVRYQLRRMSAHPSVVLWCGNNEVDLGVADGWIRGRGGASPDHAFFHETLAAVAAEEDPSRPYWASSPGSPAGAHPNDERVGDQHPWSVSLGAARGDYWAYRRDASRFPNEGGMLGPSTLKTLRELLPESERRVGSRAWMHHDNTQNTWRGEALVDHLLRVNLCERPRALSFEDYVRYGGLLHGEALETAIDTWRRRKFTSAAAVFWMFNDTWPAVVSWTPVDFFGRRKPAFWYVKRAFADVRVICVELDGELAVFLVNDRLTAVQGTLRYGLFGLGGGRPVDEEATVKCPANAATVVARRPLADWDALGVRTHGAFATFAGADGEESSHRLFRARFKELEWAPAEVRVTRGATGARLVSDAFAWAVCLDADGERPLAENYVDLVPGIERTVELPDGGEPVKASNP